MSQKCTLIIPGKLGDELLAHLFPGDRDEHGAILAVGFSRSKRGIRLIARDLFLAKDGRDYLPGHRGYRMLNAEFITEKILYCSEQKLCYLAIHNHGGRNVVRFSDTDLASHERGYPALLDINNGLPVGGLVFAENAVAGDIWLSKTERISLDETIIVKNNFHRLYPSPISISTNRFNVAYDRQIRLYGEQGQRILSGQKVGVIGAGGVGALIIENLAGLGVGEIVTVDPDRMEKYNRRRIPYSTAFQTKDWLIRLWDGFRFLATSKVAAAKRFVKRFNNSVRVRAIFGDITSKEVADEFKDCDFLFLAADTMQARLMFNSLIFQYGIPGYQVGSKVSHDKDSGVILDIFSVVRPVGPSSGCMLCNGLIDSGRLQEEALSKRERDSQRYIDEPDIPAPSVITLNALGASFAVNEYMLRVVGLFKGDTAEDYMRIQSHLREVFWEEPRRDCDCPICGGSQESIRGKGDSERLPIR